MVIMATTFIVKVKDPAHRVTIEQDAWKKENLCEGDYIKVTVEKAKIE